MGVKWILNRGFTSRHWRTSAVLVGGVTTDLYSHVMPTAYVGRGRYGPLSCTAELNCVAVSLLSIGLFGGSGNSI